MSRGRWMALSAFVLASACGEAAPSNANAPETAPSGPPNASAVESTADGAGPAPSSAATVATTETGPTVPPVATTPSSSAPNAPTPAIKAAAIATFVRKWNELHQRPSPDRAPWTNEVDKLVHSPAPPLEVRVEKCRERHAFISKTFLEIAKLALFGSVAALDRDGTCPVVFVAGGMNREAEFILDERAESVLFAWVVPEG